jgi:hypothetical protein
MQLRGSPAGREYKEKVRAKKKFITVYKPKKIVLYNILWIIL